jgi:hypothetical protein
MNVIAQAIWDGQAIMGTDGSIKAKIATYSWVLSLTSTNATTNVQGGRFLPPTAQYLQPYSKRPDAAVLFASLSRITDLLQTYPNANHTPTAQPILPIPVDNETIIKDLLQTITNQTPTFHLLSPDYDILQVICSTINALPAITTNIFHVKSHQEQAKPFEELTPDAQINVLADHQADAIYNKCPHCTGFFPTWIPDTHTA